MKTLILLPLFFIVTSCSLIGGAKEAYNDAYPLRELTTKEQRVQFLTKERQPSCQKLSRGTAFENKHGGLGPRELQIATAKEKGNAFTNIGTPKLFESDKRKFDIYRCDLERELFLAVEKGETLLMHEALGRGANINHMDENGETVLFIAARKGYIMTFETLLNLGADHEIKNKQGLAVYQKYQ